MNWIKKPCPANQSGRSAGRSSSGEPSNFTPRSTAIVIAALAVVSLARAAFADDEAIRLVAAADGPSMQLPSPSLRLDTFDAVAEEIGRSQQRVAEMEERLKDLEKQAADAKAEKAAAKEKEDKDKKKTPEPTAVGGDLSMKPSWSSGLKVESPSKDFSVKIGGRTQIDASAFSAAPGPSQPPNQGGLDPKLADTVNFRRGRLRIEGRMYEVYDWACEYDYINQLNVNNEVYPTERDSGPITAITDLWLQIRELPVLGIVRVGNMKDPYGYEHLTSSRWLNFMERSFAQDAFEGPFNNGFLPGIQILNSTADGDIGWQVGEFKNTSNPFGFSNSSGGSATVGRLVYLPVYEDEGRKLLHMAISGRTMEPRRQFTAFDKTTGLPIGPELSAVRFRSRGDIRNGPPGPLNSIYADSGLLTGTWQNMIGLELVGNNGPWSFQSEYFGSWLYNASTTAAGPLVTNGYQPKPGTNVGTVYFQSGYAEVLYFLTGESRTYSKLEYRFDRPIPRNNFYVVRDRQRGGWDISEGAWQVGVRYNYLCLNDGQVNGGVLNGLTLGLNWLLTPNARVYFNYDLTYREFTSTPWAKDSTGTVVPGTSYNGSGCINGFGTRFAFDF